MGWIGRETPRSDCIETAPLSIMGPAVPLEWRTVRSERWRVHVITIRQFSAGETIIRENETGESAFFIEQGKVEVTREMGGRSMHLAFMEAGAAFGEMSLVDESPRSATITA